MTWGKALPVLIAAGIFDLTRLFFEFFWFLGPALAAAYCTAKASGVLSTMTFGLLGTKTAAIVCTAAAGFGGAAAVEVVAPFGVVMSMAVGLIGFLVLGLWIVMSNSRLFKENAASLYWFVGSFGISELPLIGSIPAFTITLWRLYKAQIQKEGDELKKYRKEEEALQLQERRQQAAQLMQARNAQMAQTEAEEAANDEMYAQAANDENYEEIPEETRRAA